MEEEGHDPLTPEQSDAVEQFIVFTGVSPDVAKQTLEACNWDLQMAINMQIDLNVDEPEVDAVIPPPLVSSPPRNVASSDEVAPTTRFAATSTFHDADHVRAPIPPVRQILVGSDDGAFDMPILRSTRNSTNAAFGLRDTFRDFRQEALWRERLVEAESNSLNVNDEEAGAYGNSASEQEKITRLEDLFRPPLDVMFSGSLEMAKEEGVSRNKWLMVNIQNQTEFMCQVLNRDIWSNAAVKAIIREHFIFWQMDHRSSHGQRYDQFYHVTQYPYVAVLDPRTGELIHIFTQAQLSDPNRFCEVLTDFLQDRPSISSDGCSSDPKAPSLMTEISTKELEAKPVNLADMSEEDQIEAAIRASLENHQKSKDVFVNDDDDGDEMVEIFESFDRDDEESSTSSKNKNISSPKKEQVSRDDYLKHVGSSPEMVEIMFRYPNGEKEKITFPDDTTLRAVFLFLSARGFDDTKYELVANFPKRNYFDKSPDETLKESGLKRDQLYVSLKG